MMALKRKGEQDLPKSVLVGAAAGFAASWVMVSFQTFWGQVAEGRQKAKQARKQNNEESGARGNSQAEQSSEESGDPTTVKAAAAVSKQLFGHELAQPEKQTAGTIAHYTMGTVTGAIYGALAEIAPVTTAGVGLPYGAAVWMASDNVALPATGLAKPPTAYPLPTHLYALASHLVYGLTLEVFRRALWRAFESQ